MNPGQILGAVMTAILQTVGVRSATEEPRYSQIDHIGVVEIRSYAGKIAAEVFVKGEEAEARSEGFGRIAGYIFGGNISGAKIAMTAPVAQTAGQLIAMTAPVAQRPSGEGWRIRFFMPSKYTMETLPKPKDSSVQLLQLPPQTFAVMRFTGSRGAAALAERSALLREEIEKSQWIADGPIEYWFYDPPWTVPFLRRNEVAMPVRR
jgi:hypothetical protein